MQVKTSLFVATSRSSHCCPLLPLCRRRQTAAPFRSPCCHGSPTPYVCPVHVCAPVPLLALETISTLTSLVSHPLGCPFAPWPENSWMCLVHRQLAARSQHECGSRALKGRGDCGGSWEGAISVVSSHSRSVLRRHAPSPVTHRLHSMSEKG